MTVSTATSRSGPYAGAGTTGPFTVNFRFLDAAHLEVIRTDAAGEHVLVLSTDYTVAGVGNPTGSVTLLAALPVGQTLTIIRSVPVTQEADYVQNDDFPAQSHEDVLDKLTMIAQQHDETIGRSLTLPASSSSGVSTQLPVPESNRLIGWNQAANGLQNIDATTLVTIAAFGTAKADLFSGTGAQTAFTLTANPGAQANLDVAIGGVTQRPNIDYTWSSGTTLTFTTAPPLGTNNVLARYLQGLPQGTSDSAASQFVQAGAGAVLRIAQGKMREAISVEDFGAATTKLDNLSSVQAAIDAVALAGGGQVLIGPGIYDVNGTLVLKSNVELVGRGSGASRLRQRNLTAPLIQSFNYAALAGTSNAGGIRRAGLRGLTIEGTITGGIPDGTNAQHGLQVYGYGLTYDDVHIRQFGGIGLSTEWATPGTVPDTGRDDGFVESRYTALKVYQCGLSGIKCAGAHDSQWSLVLSFGNNLKDVSAAKINVWITSKGSTQYIDQLHAWGNSSGVALQVDAPVRLSNFALEGATLAQFRVNAGEVIAIGGDIFSAGSAGSKGIEYVGGPAVCIGSYIDAVIRDCTGGSIDYGAGVAAISLRARIFQNAGTVFLGTLPLITVDNHLEVSIGGAGAANQKSKVTHWQGVFTNISLTDNTSHGLDYDSHAGQGVLGIPQRAVEPAAAYYPSSGVIAYGRENAIRLHQMSGHKGALMGEPLGLVPPTNNYDISFYQLNPFQAVGSPVTIDNFVGGLNGHPFYILMPTGGAEITLSTAGNIKSKTGAAITRSGLASNRLIGFVLAKDGFYYQV